MACGYAAEASQTTAPRGSGRDPLSRVPWDRWTTSHATRGDAQGPDRTCEFGGKEMAGKRMVQRNLSHKCPIGTRGTRPCKQAHAFHDRFPGWRPMSNNIPRERTGLADG